MPEGVRRVRPRPRSAAVILTVLGGSAFSTPVLSQSLERAFADEPLVVRLVGRNIERVGAVARACRLTAVVERVAVEEYGWPERTRAISGADVVLIQVRPGGYAGRAFDETFPLPYGLPGDEGLGPGGLASAWRGWPVVKEIVADARAHNPRAPIVLLSSPLGLLVRLAGPGVIGVCELPWTTLRQICGDDDRASRAAFDYYGVNHLGWIYNLDADGRERDARLWPLRYVRLHDEQADVVAEQTRLPAARVHRLAAIARASFAAFTSADRAGIQRALGERTAEWYPDAVVPLLSALRGRPVGIPLFLTRADEGEIRERCYRASDGRLHACAPATPPPAAVEDIVSRFVGYEQLAAQAVDAASEELAVEALAIHPWVRSRDDAAALARAVVTQRSGEGACLDFASL